MKIAEVLADESIGTQDAEAAAIKRAADDLKRRKASLKIAKAQQALQKAQRAKLQALKRGP